MITPTGALMVPMLKLATMLSTRASVQARFGFTGDNAAERSLERIVYPFLEQPIDLLSYLPGLVISQGDAWEWVYESGGALNYLMPTGSLLLTFADNAQHADLRSSWLDFGNWIGAVVADLAAIAGDSDQLSIVGFKQVSNIVTCSKEEQATNDNKPYFIYELGIAYR